MSCLEAVGARATTTCARSSGSKSRSSSHWGYRKISRKASFLGPLYWGARCSLGPRAAQQVSVALATRQALAWVRPEGWGRGSAAWTAGPGKSLWIDGGDGEGGKRTGGESGSSTNDHPACKLFFFHPGPFAPALAVLVRNKICITISSVVVGLVMWSAEAFQGPQISAA